VSELERATRAIVAEDFPAAERIPQRLVALHPAFAEAWHKRGTLYYMQSRDEESVRDFHHAIALEPRHFGAMLAFAELCIAAGRGDDALFALDVALKLNPHLAASRERYERCSPTVRYRALAPQRLRQQSSSVPASRSRPPRS
jgi:tetratricopeptide (TPR) repeat protein